MFSQRHYWLIWVWKMIHTQLHANTFFQTTVSHNLLTSATHVLCIYLPVQIFSVTLKYVCKIQMLPKILKLPVKYDQTPRGTSTRQERRILFLFQDCRLWFLFFLIVVPSCVILTKLSSRKKHKKGESPWFAPTQHASVVLWKMPNQYSYAEKSSSS